MRASGRHALRRRAVRCHDSVSEAVSRRRALAVNGSAYHDGGRGGGAEGGGGEGKRESFPLAAVIVRQ